MVKPLNQMETGLALAFSKVGVFVTLKVRFFKTIYSHVTCLYCVLLSTIWANCPTKREPKLIGFWLKFRPFVFVI